MYGGLIYETGGLEEDKNQVCGCSERGHEVNCCERRGSRRWGWNEADDFLKGKAERKRRLLTIICFCNIWVNYGQIWTDGWLSGWAAVFGMYCQFYRLGFLLSSHFMIPRRMQHYFLQFLLTPLTCHPKIVLSHHKQTAPLGSSSRVFFPRESLDVVLSCTSEFDSEFLHRVKAQENTFIKQQQHQTAEQTSLLLNTNYGRSGHTENFFTSEHITTEFSVNEVTDKFSCQLLDILIVLLLVHYCVLQLT